MINKIEKKYQSYKCYYYSKVGRGYNENFNTACWASIVSQDNYRKYKKNSKNQFVLDERGNQVFTEGKVPATIYIDISNKTVNKEVVDTMVMLINKIAPCELLEINKMPFIKYKFIKNKDYNSNLLLLNFIRMLWYTYDTRIFDNDMFYDIILTYKENEDSLYFLMDCLKKCDKKPEDSYSYGDHSNINEEIVPKLTKVFMKTTIREVKEFMQKK